MTHPHTLTVVNDKGRQFVAVYRPEPTFTAGDGPYVSFFDATYAGDPRFTEHGQFVASYYADTLLHNWLTRAPTYTGGLDLCGHEPVWKLDADTMNVVRAWLRLCEERIKP